MRRSRTRRMRMTCLCLSAAYSFSIVASSISITGISSLMGYTRWHCAHLSPVPLCTSFTGVLQLGQARISRSSASTGIGSLRAETIASWAKIVPMAERRAWGCVVVAALWLGVPSLALAQTTDAYFEFLQARRLEADGDAKAALAALERAAAADPKSAEIRAEIAALHLRRNRSEE